MIVDTRVEHEQQGFSPNVDNSVQLAKASGGQVFGWWFLYLLSWCTIIIGIILLVNRIKWKNWFNQQQIQINQASSNIDVNLTKRRDTLIKLLEQTKGYIKHEKETFVLVTKYRGGNASEAEKAQMDNSLSRMFNGLNLSFEQYPQLKADSVVKELMSSSQYLETEIAASRRLYNQNVTIFNSELFIFPKIVLADSMHLQTFPMFIASQVEHQDVDMSSLSN